MAGKEKLKIIVPFYHYEIYLEFLAQQVQRNKRLNVSTVWINHLVNVKNVRAVFEVEKMSQENKLCVINVIIHIIFGA